MNAAEIEELDGRIRELKQDELTVLLIEHHMELVMAVTDRIAVLNFGQKIAEGNPDDVQTPARAEKPISARRRRRDGRRRSRSPTSSPPTARSRR